MGLLSSVSGKLVIVLPVKQRSEPSDIAFNQSEPCTGFPRTIDVTVSLYRNRGGESNVFRTLARFFLIILSAAFDPREPDSTGAAKTA